jgi:DeoR/GlpR family transcriptional regulator of sugar metabolism
MLAHQRQSAIQELVRQRGGVRVGELVRQFGVSDITIRRDLEALAERGLVAKVHGGAAPVDHHSAQEPGFTAKLVRQRAEKEAIAARAAELVSPGTAVALSAGTTTCLLAQHLLEIPGLTVLTNSVPVADVFYRAPREDRTVVLTGGIRTPSDALVGPFAVHTVQQLNLDLLFLGVHGMSPRSGFTTPNLLEAETNRALVAITRHLVVVADHTKWETLGISTIAQLSDAHTVVTDDGLGRPARERLRAEVGELIIAERTHDDQE